MRTSTRSGCGAHTRNSTVPSPPGTAPSARSQGYSAPAIDGGRYPGSGRGQRPPGRYVRVVRRLRPGSPDDPALDVAVGHALLERAARGEIAPTLRVYRPGATCAFGRLAPLAGGFDAAVAAARAHGFAGILRQPGGHAAAYDAGALCLDHVQPEPEAIPQLQARFEAAGELFATALRAVGVDARVGAIPGEYCPGQWTVSARGAVKLVGTAQRLARGASLLGGVALRRGGAAGAARR